MCRVRFRTCLLFLIVIKRVDLSGDIMYHGNTIQKEMPLVIIK